MNKPVTFLSLLSLLLAGCARSDYQTPSTPMASQWSQPVTGKSVAAGAHWWQQFHDPTLNALISRALADNNDLAVAALKVKEARLNAGLTATNLTPDVSAGVDTSRQQPLKSGAVQRSVSANLSVSYEVDLWGRLSAQRDQARWQAVATAEDRQAAALTLVGTTAQLYWQLGYLNQAINDAQQRLRYTQHTEQLVMLQYHSGAVSKLDVLQAQQSVAGQQADLEDLLQQRREANSSLAILLGQGPWQQQTDQFRLPSTALPLVPAGLPAQLLARRPDLQAAQWRLKASLANVDDVTDSFYPSLTLTGALGSSSEALRSLLNNPIATLGAGLALPFIQWPSRHLNIAIAKNQYQQAVLTFRQTLLAAFKDVEDSLSARDHLRQRGQALAAQLTAAKAAEKITRVRYEAGATAVQDWLDQQDNTRQAQLALSQNRYQQLVNLMTLYQALGGDANSPVILPQS